MSDAKKRQLMVCVGGPLDGRRLSSKPSIDGYRLRVPITQPTAARFGLIDEPLSAIDAAMLVPAFDEAVYIGTAIHFPDGHTVEFYRHDGLNGLTPYEALLHLVDRYRG